MLSNATCYRTSFRGADLREVSLVQTDLSEANLANADFADAQLRGTLLISVDVTPLCKCPVRVTGASHIDWRTVALSLHAPRLHSFLAQVGVPAVFATYMIECARAQQAEGLLSMMQSTFISYGFPNEAFARRLRDALNERGVPTFFFPEDATPGDRLHRTMRKGVNEYDRVILICSRDSLNRKGLLNEIEEVLAREARDGGASYLIPIRLDDYVFTGWQPERADLAQAIRDRVVADFSDTDSSPAPFSKAVDRLLSALVKPFNAA